MSVFVARNPSSISREEVVEIYAGNRGLSAVENSVPHLLHVDLFTLDRIKPSSQHSRRSSDEQRDDTSPAFAVPGYNIGNFAVSLNSRTILTVSAAIASCA